MHELRLCRTNAAAPLRNACESADRNRGCAHAADAALRETAQRGDWRRPWPLRRLSCPRRDSEPGQPAAADRHGVGLQGGQLDQAGIAHALQPDDAVDIDDMAAMDADEAVGVQPRLDDADGQRAEQLRLAVEDIGVVGVGVDGDDVVDRHDSGWRLRAPPGVAWRPAAAASRRRRAG